MPRSNEPHPIETYQLKDEASDLVVGTVADVAALTGVCAADVYRCACDGQPIDGIIYALRNPAKHQDDDAVPENGLLPGGEAVREVRVVKVPVLGPGAVYEFEVTRLETELAGGAYEEEWLRIRAWPNVAAAAGALGITSLRLMACMVNDLDIAGKRYSFKPELDQHVTPPETDEGRRFVRGELPASAPREKSAVPHVAMDWPDSPVRVKKKSSAPPPPHNSRAARCGAGAGTAGKFSTTNSRFRFSGNPENSTPCEGDSRGQQQTFAQGAGRPGDAGRQ